MNKKGFTLVEMLAIMAVLGIMVLLVVPQIGGSIDSKKEKELEKIIDIIENSGKTYHVLNEDVYKIPVTTLVEEDYITNDLTNPVTGEKLDGCVKVSKNTEGIYTYTYKSCDSIQVPFSVELGGGTPGQTFESSYEDATKIELVNPTKENSDFAGWEIVKGDSILEGNTLIIGETETILHAKWESWPILTVNYNGGDKSQTLNNSYRSGTTITLVPPTRVGYEFTGWKVTSGNSIVSGNKFTIGSEDTTLEANWTANGYTYNIVYKSSNGVELGTGATTYDYGTTNTINPKEFTGYTSPASQSIAWDSTTAKTITFIYNPITYTISYTLNGGNVSPANKTSYTIETDTFTLTNPTKTGYTFTGWTGSNGNTLSTRVSITKGSTGNKNYTANWRADLKSIAVTTAPIKTEYSKGETFDPTGMVVTATYSDGSTVKVTDYTIVNGDQLTEDMTTVQISYTENGITVTTAYEVEIKKFVVLFSRTFTTSKDFYGYYKYSEDIAEPTFDISSINTIVVNGDVYSVTNDIVESTDLSGNPITYHRIYEDDVDIILTSYYIAFIYTPSTDSWEFIFQDHIIRVEGTEFEVSIGVT